jgi:hypothetical protein
MDILSGFKVGLKTFSRDSKKEAAFLRRLKATVSGRESR